MPHGGQGQVRVDRVISDTRTELAARKQAELDPGALEQARLHERIAEELALVARRLEGLELDLLGDPAMVVRHATAPGNRRVGAYPRSCRTFAHRHRPDLALRTIGMADLRRRLDRASRL